MNPLFQFHKLNDEGIKRAKNIADIFDSMLLDLIQQVGSGAATREFAIVRTKLEEACFFAKKSMASQTEHQERAG